MTKKHMHIEYVSWGEVLVTVIIGIIAFTFLASFIFNEKISTLEQKLSVLDMTDAECVEWKEGIVEVYIGIRNFESGDIRWALITNSIDPDAIEGWKKIKELYSERTPTGFWIKRLQDAGCTTVSNGILEMPVEKARELGWKG